MNLISKEDAAKVMDVPVLWVNGMIEKGLLATHEDLNGHQLIDADEIIVKRYASKEFECASIDHIRALLRSYSIESRI